MKEEIVNRIEYILGKYSDENDILYQLRKLVYERDLQTNFVRETKPLMGLFSENLDSLLDKKTDNYLITTGFEGIDKEIGGFTLGEYIVIGSRPAMGKTQLMINLALNISLQHPVMYYSFDMTDFILTHRIISTLTGIPVDKILQHKLSQDEVMKIVKVENIIHKYKIFVKDSYNSSVSAFKDHSLKQISENGVKVILVDFLQLMSSNRYRNHRELEVSYISRELKKIAKENNVCVIVSSQLSRAPEIRSGSKRPYLSDLRESGAIEQDADKVIFVHRPEVYGFTEDEEGNSLINVVELIISKNRNGRLGEIRLTKDNDFTSLMDFQPPPDTFEFNQNRLDELAKDASFGSTVNLMGKDINHRERIVLHF